MRKDTPSISHDSNLIKEGKNEQIKTYKKS